MEWFVRNAEGKNSRPGLCTEALLYATDGHLGKYNTPRRAASNAVAPHFRRSHLVEHYFASSLAGTPVPNTCGCGPD